MKSLLYPAVAFMNRLTFGMKFSLISVLFLLPMLATNYYLVRDSWREFQGTRIELQSLDLLGSSLALRRDLETLNNQVQINATLGQSGKAGDIENKITALEDSLLQRLQSFHALSADPEQAAAFEAKRDEMIAAFKAQQQETSLLSKSALIGKLLNKAQMLSQIIASQSGLSRDPQGDLRQLSELITSVTPQVTQTLGEGRAMGAYSLGQGFLNSSSSTRFDELLQQLEKLQAEYGLKLQDALGSSKPAHAALASLADASKASLKQGSELFEEQVVVAETLDAPWQGFYDDVSTLMAKTYQLDEATLTFLEQQLEQRLSENRTHMIGLVAALASVFLLIFYLYAGFYGILMLFAAAISQDPNVIAHPQQGWFLSLFDIGGPWMLALAIVIVLAASIGHVDGCVQVCGTQFANDLATWNTPRTDRQLTLLAKSGMVVFIVAASVLAYLTFDYARLQLLAQISYQGIIQLAVPLFFGIFSRRGNKEGAIAGMLAGIVVAIVLTTMYPDDIPGLGSLTSGIVGLVVNAGIFVACAWAIKPSAQESARVEQLFEMAAPGRKVPMGATPVLN